METKQFRRWVRWLRGQFPVLYPVDVRLVRHGVLRAGDCGGFTAYCKPDGTPSHFCIRVEQHRSDTLVVDSLMEEWAHMHQSMVAFSNVKTHDEVYGAIFNSIKRRWEDASELQRVKWGLPSHS